MRWQIHIPISNRPLDLTSAYTLSCAVEDADDRLVTRRILEHVATSPHWPERFTARQLAEEFDHYTEEQRRTILDRARHDIGLPTTAEAEAEAKHAAYQANFHAQAATRPDNGVPPICAAEGCITQPLDPSTGLLICPDVRRWWCSQHADQAEPGDLEPRTAGLTLDPTTGALIDVGEQDAEQRREARQAERERLERQERAAERAAQAERDELRQEAERQQIDHEMPWGFPRP